MQTHEITLMDVRLNELVTTGLVTFSQPLVPRDVKGSRLGMAYKIRQ
jgi:hypothetical protein